MTTLFASAIPLMLFAAVATISPGKSTTLVTASSAQLGLRRSLPLLAGISLGLASLAFASALGLATMLLAVPMLQIVVKAVGTAYLLWLAWKVASGGAPSSSGSRPKPISLLSGNWMLWLNLKAWAMTLGAAASFATLAPKRRTPVCPSRCSFATFSLQSLTVWCLAGALFARMLTKPLHWRILNATLGVLLAASVVPMWK